jgi:peptidoglycan hydrolase-like protein with peptidoglycan-binding domain
MQFLASIAEAARQKPTLRKGDRGNSVVDLQTHLNREMNNALGIDGDFGTRTENVLRLYQKSRGLVADGVAGFLTWSHLLAEAFN